MESLLKILIFFIKEQGVKVTSLRQKHAGAKLSIENAKKGTIFVPIPYEEGWQCKVNGVNVSDQLTSFDGMLGIPVEEGTNDIANTTSQKRSTDDGGRNRLHL